MGKKENQRKMEKRENQRKKMEKRENQRKMEKIEKKSKSEKRIEKNYYFRKILKRIRYFGMFLQSIMRDILCGADYLHSRGISHRDLKPRNILVSTTTYDAKIADFGLSKFITFPVRRSVENFGTRWYRAPEVLLGMKITTMRVDMWSIGTIFSEMKEKQALFPGRDHDDQIHVIFATLGTPTKDTWPEVGKSHDFQDLALPHYPENRLDAKTVNMSPTERDFLRLFLQYDAVRRISASDALKLPFLAAAVAPVRVGLANRQLNSGLMRHATSNSSMSCQSQLWAELWTFSFPCDTCALVPCDK